jgi:hypothetical protein
MMEAKPQAATNREDVDLLTEWAIEQKHDALIVEPPGLFLFPFDNHYIYY